MPQRWRVGRSTNFGTADNFDAARGLAEAKQMEWFRVRERPVVSIDGDQIIIVREAQRSDEEPQQLVAFLSVQVAEEHLRANFLVV